MKAERRRIIAINGNEVTLGEPVPAPEPDQSRSYTRGDWIYPFGQNATCGSITGEKHEKENGGGVVPRG